MAFALTIFENEGQRDFPNGSGGCFEIYSHYPLQIQAVAASATESHRGYERVMY